MSITDDRQVKRRLAILRHAEEVTGNVAMRSSARLATGGRLSSANLVVRTEPTLTFATLVECRHPAARVAWFFLRPIHVVVFRAVLSGAVSSR
jgi:hypothetical protein